MNCGLCIHYKSWSEEGEFLERCTHPKRNDFLWGELESDEGDCPFFHPIGQPSFRRDGRREVGP